MGLDMYLYKKEYIGAEYEHNIDPDKQNIFIINDKEFPIKNLSYIIYNVGYWRKANAIHNFFVNECQDGEDDCKEYYVPIHILNKLYKICIEIHLIHKHQSNTEEGIKRITELLPPKKGFFFGSNEINDDYFDDIQHTITILEPLLNSDYIYYQSSW